MKCFAGGNNGRNLSTPLLSCGEHIESIDNDRGAPGVAFSSERECPAEINRKEEKQNDCNYNSNSNSNSSSNSFCSHAVEISGQPSKRLVAELQIETLSTACVRVFLYSWYAMLFLALVIQSFVSLQWEMRNICGATPQSIQHLENWHSPCVENITYDARDVNFYTNTLSDRDIFPLPMEEQQGSSITFGNKTKGSNLDVVKVNSSTRRRVYNLRWVGSGYERILNFRFNRFVQVILSMASPRDKFPSYIKWKRYKLSIALFNSSQKYADSNELFYLREGKVGESEALLQQKPPLYNISIICYRDSPRCDSVGLPLSTAVFENRSNITFTIVGIDEELGELATDSAVGIIFQRYEYTVGTIVLRYTFLALSFLHFIRFIYRKRYSKTLYEQNWIIFLHICLYVYLDPLFAVGVYEIGWKTICYFFEFHFPNFFAAFLCCFIFALITATISCADKSTNSGKLEFVKKYDNNTLKEKMSCYHKPCYSASFAPSVSLPEFQKDTFSNSYANCAQTSVLITPGEQQQQKREGEEEEETANKQTTVEKYEVKPQICAYDLKVFHHSDGVRPICAVNGGMPLAAKIAMSFYLLSVFSLKFFQIYFEGWDWEESLLRGVVPCMGIRYALYGLLLISFSCCSGLLIKLSRKLGERPYLATRPQQLACRVFIFVFTTALFYFVLQVALIALLYPQTLEIVAYQPFTWVSSLVVSTFFVNYITFVYTTTVASRRVPIRPENPQWRRVFWSSEWYRWLDLHGGILYIFYNEQQERYFNWLQKKGRMSVKKRHKSKSDVVKKVGDKVCSQTKSHGVSCNSNHDGLLSEFNDEFDGESGSEFKFTGVWDNSGNGRGDNTFVEHCKYCGVFNVSHNDQKKAQSVLERTDDHLCVSRLTFLDRLEGVFVDSLQNIFLRKSTPLSFFNLETAIDCLNLSWEAYVRTDISKMVQGYESKSESVSGVTDERLVCEGSFSAQYMYTADSKNDAISSCVVENNEENKKACDKNNEHAHGYGCGIKKSTESCLASSEGAQFLSLSLATSMICTEQYGYKKLAVFEGLDVQVIVAVMDTSFLCHRQKLPRILIAFRGTDNISNAREGLRIRKREWREVGTMRHWGIGQKAKVHTGFLNIWVSLKEKVLRTLTTYMNEHSEEVFSIFCTGHSLGGALACLCAYSVYKMLRLIKYPLSEVTVYTFGQPPVGNKAFQSAYNKAVPRTFRVVNESDAVCFLSFTGCHVGVEVNIDRYGNYICKPMFIERLFRPTKGRGFSVVNHTLAAYALSLNAVADFDSENVCKVRCLEPYLSNCETQQDNILPMSS